MIYFALACDFLYSHSVLGATYADRPLVMTGRDQLIAPRHHGFGLYSIAMRSVHTGEVRSEFGLSGYVDAIAYSEINRSVCGISGKKRYLWSDTLPGRKTIEGTTSSLVLDVTYSPNGQWVTVCTIDGGIELLDATVPAIASHMQIPGIMISSACVEDSGRWCFATGEELYLIDFMMGSYRSILASPRAPVCAFKNGRKAMVAFEENGRARLATLTLSDSDAPRVELLDIYDVRLIQCSNERVVIGWREVAGSRGASIEMLAIQEDGAITVLGSFDADIAHPSVEAYAVSPDGLLLGRATFAGSILRIAVNDNSATVIPSSDRSLMAQCAAILLVLIVFGLIVAVLRYRRRMRAEVFIDAPGRAV